MKYSIRKFRTKVMSKKLIIYILPIICILLLVVIVKFENISKLMNNTTVRYYCDDFSYQLEGEKCVKKDIKSPLLLADVNQDGVVDNSDLLLLEDYLDKEETNASYLLSDEQFLSGDINKDNEVTEADYSILRDYFEKAVSTYSMYYDKIGIEKVCLHGYSLTNNSCIYKQVVPALKENVVAENNYNTNGTSYTIKFNSNGGTGTMKDILVLNNDSIKIPNNNFVNGIKKFAGWNVYSTKQNKWLCYKTKNGGNNISDRTYDINCTFGKVIINDEEKLSNLTDVDNDELMFYAQWIDANGDVDVSFTYNNTSKYLTKGSTVVLQANFKVTGGKYYYKWMTYSYDKLHYTSPCQDVFNGKTGDKSLSISSDRQGAIQLYSDSKCTIKYKDEYKTNKYYCSDCKGVTAVFDNITRSSYKKGEVVKNYVKFNISDTSKQYYYNWKTYQNGNLVYTSNCQKAVGDKKFQKDLTINGSRKGLITVYSDASCRNQVSSTWTKRFTCTDCPPVKVTINSNYSANQTNGKVVKTNVNFKVYDKEDPAYYYRWRTYNYGTYHTEGACIRVPLDGSHEKELSITNSLQVRKGTVTVYSDSSCKKKINSVPVVSTKEYKCTNCPPLEIKIGKNLSSGQTKGTVIHNSIIFNIFNKTKKYYYRWRTYNYGKFHEQGGCNEVKSGVEYVKDLWINNELQVRKGTITVYSDSSCKNRINTVPVAQTTEYRCTNCAPVEVKIDNHLPVNWSENTTIKNYIEIKKYNNNTYYYKWRVYKNGFNVETSTCQIIKANMSVYKNFDITGTMQGKITIYSDSSCNNRVSSVAEAYTNKYRCTNCLPIKSIKKFKKINKNYVNVYIEDGISDWKINRISNFIDKMYNDNKFYIAASNVVLYTQNTYDSTFGTNSCGEYQSAENTIILNAAEKCRYYYDSSEYDLAAIKHEFGHSMDYMNERLTGTMLSKLKYNNKTINYYIGSNRPCHDCLRPYSLTDSREFIADIIAYKELELEIDDELLSLRTKILNTYFNNCNKNVSNFNKMRSKFYYNNSKAMDKFFTKYDWDAYRKIING